MKLDKNIKIFISVLGIVFFLGQNAQATEECFEKTSRAIFKFNLTLDNYIFEHEYPRTNGYALFSADGWGTFSAGYTSGAIAKYYGGTAAASYE